MLFWQMPLLLTQNLSKNALVITICATASCERGSYTLLYIAYLRAYAAARDGCFIPTFRL